MFCRTHAAAGVAGWLTFAALGMFTVACARATGGVSGPVPATATLHDATGKTVGTVAIASESSGGVRLHVQVAGLPPGRHGLHVHAVGLCDSAPAPTFSSAGGHFNPGSKQHGRLNPNGPHAGDLPNIEVDASGKGVLDVVVPTLGIDSGANALLDADGSAIVVHANPDDERTDSGPAGPGNSGARIACGVITRTVP